MRGVLITTSGSERGGCKGGWDWLYARSLESISLTRVNWTGCTRRTGDVDAVGRLLRVRAGAGGGCVDARQSSQSSEVPLGECE